MNILSLFDGISAGQIALRRAKIKYSKYYASEIDKYAIKVTQKNYPNTIQLGDILGWKEWDIDHPNLLFAGFPCQPYSIAGKRKGLSDTRGGDLVSAMFEVIDFYKPEDIMMENVNGLLSIDGGETFKHILEKLNNTGYAVDWMVINSALVSAQNRKRVYIISKRIGLCESYTINVDKSNKRNCQEVLF